MEAIMATYTLQRPSSWSPWSGLLDELRREVNPALRRPNAESQGTRGVYPPVNLFETEEGYVLTAELPGVPPESVDVSIEGSTVTLSGERKIEYAAGDGTAVHRRERQSGVFRRGFELPTEIDVDAAKATHKNGVLTLNLPKSPATKPRQITIETR
jgi:HSP20 family protein